MLCEHCAYCRIDMVHSRVPQIGCACAAPTRVPTNVGDTSPPTFPGGASYTVRTRRRAAWTRACTAALGAVPKGPVLSSTPRSPMVAMNGGRGVLARTATLTALDYDVAAACLRVT